MRFAGSVYWFTQKSRGVAEGEEILCRSIVGSNQVSRLFFVCTNWAIIMLMPSVYNPHEVSGAVVVMIIAFR